jgi:catechol-2,3-dioxygenase
MEMPPKIDGILESSLYVSDLTRSIRFYREVFGFPVISEFGERGCAMHAGTRQILLLNSPVDADSLLPSHKSLCKIKQQPKWSIPRKFSA